MADVSTRGGALPRGAPQRGHGRGRGRGAGHHLFNGSDPQQKLNGHRSHFHSQNALPAPPDEPVELRNLRRKHAQNLCTIKELFPSWTDEDLLMALNEASGDLELAAARISEGLTEQWGSVKTKKDKKAAVPPQSAPQNARTHGSAPGGPRGRGDITRGPRGGGRGAAPRGAARGRHTLSSPRSSQPATSNQNAVGSVTPSVWSVGPPNTQPVNGVTTQGDPAPMMPGEVDQNDLPDNQVDVVQGSRRPDRNLGNDNVQEASVQTLVDDQKITPDPHKKPASRVIAPGSKMSWAQIARSADPPKLPVAPAPVASLEVHSELGVSPCVDGPTLESAAGPELTSHGDPVSILIPGPAADVWHTEPVPAIDDLKNNVSAAGPNVWNDDPVLQPMGVGEGWAETVLAQASDPKASIFDSQAASGCLLTPSDAANIGPIELSASSPAPVLDQPLLTPSSPVPNASDIGLQPPETSSGSISGAQRAMPPSVGSILAPPGLSKRTSTRKGQEAAVVMPGSGTPSMERVGLKFGSLSLFGEAKENVGAPAPPPSDEPSPPQPPPEDPRLHDQSNKVEERLADKPVAPSQVVEPASSPRPPAVSQVMEEKVSFAAPAVVVSYNPTQGHVTPQPSAPQSSHQTPQPPQHHQQSLNSPVTQPQGSMAPVQSSSFASRYSSANPYAADVAASHSTGAHPPAVPQAQPQDNFAHQTAFRQDPMSVYFQQQQQQQQPPAHQQPPPQSSLTQHSTNPAPTGQTVGGYGSFSHLNQQHPQPGQQPNPVSFGQVPQSAPDYTALYGQEALRSLGYYDSYAHAQAAFQARSSHGADETTKPTAAAAPAPPQSQAQQVAHHQHQQQPAAVAASATTQHYPGMQPSPMPYPYYPYYQQYGQLPPNYQNPGYAYGLQGPTPYYSAQGSQQYPIGGARASQNQYPMQPGPANSAVTGAAPLPSSHAHQQPQHTSQQGLAGVGLANNAGFRQVSQPGVAGSQISAGQASAQGVVPGNVGGMAPGMPTAQQPGSMHQQHTYYGSGYGAYGADPQQAQPPQSRAAGSGTGSAGHHHHHHHHHSQQQPQQHNPRPSNHHPQHNQQGSGQNVNVGPGGNEHKDPFVFASDRFFNQ